MRKLDDGEKEQKEKIMYFIVATNVVASLPPERWLTRTPTARAKRDDMWILFTIEILKFLKICSILTKSDDEQNKCFTCIKESLVFFFGNIIQIVS